MSFFEQMKELKECEMLIAFTDLTGFVQLTSNLSDEHLFYFMREYFSLHEDIVEKGGGKVLKIMGDSSMLIFPGEGARQAMTALWVLRMETAKWMKNRGYSSRLDVKAHLTKAVVGPFGRSGRLDVYGEGVNKTAMLPQSSFSASAEAFAFLQEDLRVHFVSHNLPVPFYRMED